MTLAFIEDFEEVQALLKLLQEITWDSAPVIISLGYVSKGGTCKKGIVIKEAPSIVIGRLAQEGYQMEIESDGVHVVRRVIK